MRTSLILVAVLACAFGRAQTTIRMMAGPSQGIPPKENTDPRSLARRGVFEEFHRRNPDVEVVNAGGLELNGDYQEQGFLMAMAGANAPDVFYVNFRQYYDYIDQGFCRPLDDLIAKNPESLSRLNPNVGKVLRSYDGHYYAIPWYQVAAALYYRKDHFLDAGLDPSKPPKNWDEFLAYARRLSEHPGRDGFAFDHGMGSRAYHWTNMVFQAGGEVVVPAEGGYWKSAVATPETAKALDFYRRLVAEKWTGKDGKTYGPAAAIVPDLSQDVAAGKVSMWFNDTNDVVMNLKFISPSVLGIAAMPAGPGGHANEINAGMWAINSTVKDPKKLDACWRFIRYFAGDEAARINTQRFVEMGMGNLVNPTWLERFGYRDQLASVDPGYVEANKEAFKDGKPEPYGRNCNQAYLVMDNALDRAVLDPNRPSIDILREVSKEMDEKLLGYVPPAVQATRRGWALGILIGLLAVGGAFAGRAIAAARRKRGVGEGATGVAPSILAGSDKRRVWRFVGFCVAPAAISILVWGYYPLLKGLVIAFQDYRILKGSQWIGLDNFIAAFTNPIFYKSLFNSFLYVALSLIIGFFLPILLALALNEIPRAKVFFRTVFYLPAMTSPIVIAFLWREFYEKSETGILNSVLGPGTDLLNKIGPFLHIPHIEKAHDWLGNPTLAMFAVVLPGIWAGAGPGSILYLAALKNIPDERYEAADIDGASWKQKIRYVVLPGLRPLILINLLGVFIAGFKAMDNIFVLTGGGPLYSTHTIGLEVWTNAFLFLKFGYATAAAWVMGAILIGFTLFQIRSLLGMKFQAAKL